MSTQRYLVSARKYRPQQFGDLVAQEHVSRTLQNALKLDRLAHAYLFSGPRGVGKTTAARILAKAINCEHFDSEPCRTCPSCQDFEQGRSLSIFEIDAASNNKVEDVRDLQETVQIPPQGGRKKVYIVDEVHMLSKPAFNALLKTLEEPPPHVLFIFATTEPHKVLATILSRCQRFDFRRIPLSSMVAHLRHICTSEDITADEDALLLLARKGDGALRDALSAFDQAVALCGTDLTHAALSAAFGEVNVEHFFEATRHAAERNRAGMLHLVDTLLQSGNDVQEIFGGLAHHLRNLLVACTLQDTSLIPVSDVLRARYLKESAAFTESTLLRLLMTVEEAQRTIASTSHTRLHLELALLKMATMQNALVLTDAIQRMDELIALARKNPGAVPPAVSPPPPPSRPKATPQKEPAPRVPKKPRTHLRKKHRSHPRSSKARPRRPSPQVSRPHPPRRAGSPARHNLLHSKTTALPTCSCLP